MSFRLPAAALLFLTIASTASAQISAPYFENFDTPAPFGWGFGNSSAEVGWAFDNDPGITLVGNGLGGAGTGGPAAGGSPGSLNYNDGLDFEEDVAMGTHNGTATSALIDISSLAGNVSISFDINFETDFYSTGNPSSDEILVLVNGTTGVFPFEVFWAYVATIGDNSTPAGEPFANQAGPMGTWRRVAFSLPPGWGPTAIQLSFQFSTNDAVENAFSGVFIDNVRICSDSLPPSAPTNLSPADGALLLMPLGAPLSLDWSDGADTTDCGPGAVARYTWNIINSTTMLSVASGSRFTSDLTLPGGLPPGTYLWEVSAIDGSGLISPLSTRTSFTIETALAPLAPDSLFVNTSRNGAQEGDGGFVEHLADQTPVFSAIFRDPNTADIALGYRLQVSQDPTFLTTDYDSGLLGLSPGVPKDARCQDLDIAIDLERDQTYYWRIQFADASGVIGAFSLPQTFETGDDYDFGVRAGSSHRSRRCYVATASWGSVSPEVSALQAVRNGVLEPSGSGAWFSRMYHSAGQPASELISTPSRRHAGRTLLSPLATVAAHPTLSVIAALAFLVSLAVSALRRLQGTPG